MRLNNFVWDTYQTLTAKLNTMQSRWKCIQSLIEVLDRYCWNCSLWIIISCFQYSYSQPCEETKGLNAVYSSPNQLIYTYIFIFLILMSIKSVSSSYYLNTIPGLPCFTNSWKCHFNIKDRWIQTAMLIPIIIFMMTFVLFWESINLV